jgi:hypothetical protein
MTERSAGKRRISAPANNDEEKLMAMRWLSARICSKGLEGGIVTAFQRMRRIVLTRNTTPAVARK